MQYHHVGNPRSLFKQLTQSILRLDPKISIFIAFTVTLLSINVIEARAFVQDFTTKTSFAQATSKLSMSSSNEQDAAAYNRYFSSSVDIKSGYVRNGLLTASRSVRDIDNNKRRSFLYQVCTSKDRDGNVIRINIPPMEESSSIKARIPSPSGNKVAVFMKENDSKTGKTKQVMEIWSNGGSTLQRRIVLPTNILHGDVCTDTSWFGGMSWRPRNEDVIVYVAEKKSEDAKSFFDVVEKEKDSETTNTIVGQFTLGAGKKEDWGEKYVGTANLGLFCVSITSGNVVAVENVPSSGESKHGNPDTFTLGQPIFTPCGNSIVYTAWDAGGGGLMPRKLGSIYCYQRSSALHTSSIQNLIEKLHNADINKESKDGPSQCLTPKHALARSARFPNSSLNPSVSTSKLAFLCSSKGFDTHGGCMALHTIDWDCDNNAAVLSSEKALVDEIRLPEYSKEARESKAKSTLLGMSFPGIFTGDLPQECFSPDGSSVFLTTMWGSVTRVVKVSTSNGDIRCISFNLDSENETEISFSSQQVVCVSEDGVIVAQSSPNTPRVVGLLSSDIFDSVSADVISCKSICDMHPMSVSGVSALPTPEETLGEIATNISWEMIVTENEDNKQLPPIQSILMMPTSEKNTNKPPPLIVVPHGGPHSCSITSYMPSYAYLCGHGGYAILLVNYHGSTGFGQDSLEALAGEAGTLDVKDVVKATKDVIALNKVDPGKVGICGGSHGGFLTGHLIGKYPELFKVAAMRNPVTNIATMVTATDIPDWAYVETFGSNYYDFSKFRGPNRQELGDMWDASPIASVLHVKAPTLVALGMMDRRVPPSQGLEYYHTLRSNGVATKLLVYEKDVHAIDIPVSEADHWVNIKQWFDEHL